MASELYINLTTLERTTNLKRLLPNVINPQNLTDAELEAKGVAKCVIERPAIEWWQAYGEEVADDTVRPVAVTWEVLDLSGTELDERAKSRAQQAAQQALESPIAYSFPDGDGEITPNPETLAMLADVASLDTGDEVAVEDQAGAVHVLTAPQAVALLRTLSAHRRNVKVAAHGLRSAIQQPTTDSKAYAVLPEEWQQTNPDGTNRLYMKGDLSLRLGDVWMSMIDNNVNTPESGTWIRISIRAGNQYPEWAQPIGGWGYVVGWRTISDGLSWESDTPNNVWEPGAFGWVAI